MSKRLQFVVVGAGSMGKRRVSHLLKMEAGDVVVVDQREDRCQEAAARFGARTATALDTELIQSADAMLVCVPPSAHLGYLKMALDHGLHAFVEKPIAASMDGVDDLLKEIHHSDRIFAAGCNLRFHPSIRRIKEVVDKGIIGPILAGHVEIGQYLPDWHPWEDYRQYYPSHRSEGGGLDAVCDLDYLCWILGEARDVACFSGKLSSLESDTDDVAFFLLRFESGAIVSLQTDMIQREHVQRCKLIGEQGTIVWDIHDKAVKVYSAETKSWTRYPEPDEAIEAGYFGDTEEFVLAIREGRRPLHDLFSETKLLRLVLEGLGSSRLKCSDSGAASADAQDRHDFSARAHHVIPGGAHTYSKGDDQFPCNAPRAFARGKGGRIWDLDGNEFVDWGMGINNVLIGHAEDIIDESVIEALRQGQSFSRPTELEVEAAEALVALFEGMDMAKFGKNGSDANTAALRLSRAVTGRELVAYDASAPFLSIHDWFIGTTAMHAGVPRVMSDLTVPFQYNDFESIERLFADNPRRLAAVILEPCREISPKPGFLERLRTLCNEHGTLLVFDEIITAFRYGLHGASGLFGVRPDLMSVGKGMANGYALTALLGRRVYMERGGIYQDHPRCFLLSTTNGAERSALAAGLATIRFYRAHNVIGRLYKTGQRVIDGLNQIASRHGIAEYVGAFGDFPCRPVLKVLGHDGRPSMEYRTLFVQELIREGVFMSWVCPCFRHGEKEITRTLEAFDAACAVYGKALERKSVKGLLEGIPARPVFRSFNKCLQTRCGRIYADAEKLSCCLADTDGSK